MSEVHTHIHCSDRLTMDKKLVQYKSAKVFFENQLTMWIINKEHCICNYYLYIACYTIFMSLKSIKHSCTYIFTLLILENWLLDIYEHMSKVAIMVHLFSRHSNLEGQEGRIWEGYGTVVTETCKKYLRIRRRKLNLHYAQRGCGTVFLEDLVVFEISRNWDVC